jgi:hypothetical protein
MSKVTLTKEQELLSKFLANNAFSLYHSDDYTEVETWTNGDVNMIHTVHDFSVSTLIETLEQFDIDEEIDLHRQGDDYKQAFTIRESLEDFTDYKKRIDKVVKKLKTQKRFSQYLEKQVTIREYVLLKEVK